MFILMVHEPCEMCNKTFFIKSSRFKRTRRRHKGDREKIKNPLTLSSLEMENY